MASKQEGTTHIGVHHGIIVVDACPDEVGIPANPGIIYQDIQVAHAGISSGADREQDRALAQAYAAARVTWWLEHLVPVRWGSWSDWPLEAMRQRILQGPPRSERT